MATGTDKDYWASQALPSVLKHKLLGQYCSRQGEVDPVGRSDGEPQFGQRDWEPPGLKWGVWAVWPVTL